MNVHVPSLVGRSLWRGYIPEVEVNERLELDERVRQCPDDIVVDVETLQGPEVAHLPGDVGQPVLGQV